MAASSGQGPGAVLDVFASRDHARGGMARRPPRLVVTTERGASSAGAVVPLPDGAILAVLGGDPSGALPDATRTLVRERRARVLPLSLGEGPSVLAAVAAGAALAAASRVLGTPLEGGGVLRLVAEGLAGKGDASAAAERAQAAFEATRDVLASS